VSAERGGGAGASHRREVHVGGNLTNTALAALVAGAGFEPARFFFSMERELSQPVPDVASPGGVRVLPFGPEWSEATRLAHNEAFLDHWGSRPRDEEDWRTWVTGSRMFRPSRSWLAVDGDEVAAYVLGYEFAADTAATGVRDLHIGQVGTRRSYRGRGLARALLARTLAAGRQAGYGSASLGVDADNPTGALGLYERLGFTVRRKYVTYVKEIS
jgi:ribosomal protein S18 acetylase RimI-like enzyme